MQDFESLGRSRWECKYHVVFIPKCRRQALYKELRQHLGEVFQSASQKKSRIEEGHLLADHVHMLISIPPKHAVAHMVGFLKGKSAIHIARTFMGASPEFTGPTLLGPSHFKPPALPEISDSDSFLAVPRTCPATTRVNRIYRLVTTAGCQPD